MSLEVRLATPADLPAAFALRHAVFVLGQGVPPDMELDEHDADCDHAIALSDGEFVGTGRLLAPPAIGLPEGMATVGRMAVARLRRGQGVGAALLTALEDRAVERGWTAVELHAQLHARAFYERAGYRAVGGTYLEAGIEHVTMRKPLIGRARRAATG